jgi:hypothetical protein
MADSSTGETMSAPIPPPELTDRPHVSATDSLNLSIGLTAALPRPLVSQPGVSAC